jgi:hypothetical protein
MIIMIMATFSMSWSVPYQQHPRSCEGCFTISSRPSGLPFDTSDVPRPPRCEAQRDSFGPSPPFRSSGHQGSQNPCRLHRALRCLVTAARSASRRTRRPAHTICPLPPPPPPVPFSTSLVLRSVRGLFIAELQIYNTTIDISSISSYRTLV